MGSTKLYAQAMRKTGLALLLLGFLWLVQLQVVSALRGGVRPVLDAQYKAIEAQKGRTYSAPEVEERVHATAVAAYDAAPSLFAIPGAIMLLGGLLAARRSRENPTQST